MNLNHVPDLIMIDTVSGGEEGSEGPIHSIDSNHSETLLEPQEMGFKIGGYIEPKALEEMETKVIPLSPQASGNPPSYDAVMAQKAQQQEERKLIGAVLLKTSHFFGMHPFKAPYTCNGDVCERRG